MDNLSEILDRISFSAEVFFSGNLCGIQTLGGTSAGHLHLLESGKLTILTNEGHKVVLDKPTVIFFPGPTVHRIISEESENAKLVCATVQFESANRASLINSLPQFVYFEISDHELIGQISTWLFKEAFEDKVGRQGMLDRLSDIFLLQILRYVLDSGAAYHGILSALSHPQLSKVIDAIHKQPEKPWTLEMLADIAAMSRSKFASIFKQTVGQPPNDYITDLRLSLAQNLLRKNRPVSLVANDVGYEHGSALARIFKKKLGVSPKEWVQELSNK